MVVVVVVQVAVSGQQVVQPGRLGQMQTSHAMISGTMENAGLEMTASSHMMCSRQCHELLVQHTGSRSSRLDTWWQRVPHRMMQKW